MMKLYGTAYFTTAIIFLAIDSVWLTVTASRLYRPLLGDLLMDGFRPVPAILFYLIYIAAIVFFAIQPAFGTGRWTTAALYGAAFGFCAYATYDLTNQATLRNWPIAITIADLCWGTVLTAISATLGYIIASRVAGA